MSGENKFDLKLVSQPFQSINMGLIPAGMSVTETFDIVAENDAIPTGPVYVKPISQPDWAEVEVTYTELVMSSMPPPPLLVGGGDMVVTGSPVPPPAQPVVTDSDLLGSIQLLSSKGETATLGMSLDDLTGAGVPWPAGNVYLPSPPPAPPAPSTLPPLPPLGMSKCPPYDGMKSNVNKFPYARMAPAIVTGPMAGVLDLDTHVGRKFKLTVKLSIHVDAYDRENPARNAKQFTLELSPSGKFAFACVVVDPEAKQVGEAPAGLPSYVLARVPRD